MMTGCNSDPLSYEANILPDGRSINIPKLDRPCNGFIFTMMGDTEMMAISDSYVRSWRQPFLAEEEEVSRRNSNIFLFWRRITATWKPQVENNI